METMESKIIDMITELQPYVEFDANTNLLEEDVLDSVSALVLIQELEEEFEITIDAEEITDENLKTVENILNLVKSKLK